jgi:hypothetical protein
MHQCLDELKTLLNSDISEAEFDRALNCSKEIIREAAFKRRRVEMMVESFMLDRSNVTLYSAIINALRSEIEATRNTNLVRHEELKLIRNRIYQYKPLGYIPPGRSANFHF